MKRDEKAQAILDAAVRVFHEKSFHGATTKEIADAAGVSVGALFRHFPNKEDLLLGLVDQLISTVAPRFFASSMEQVLHDFLGTCMEEALRGFIHGRLVLFHENRTLISVIHAESAYNPRVKQAMFLGIYDPMRTVLEKFIALGIARGLFRAVEPAAAARAVASSVLYTFLDVWYQDADLTGPTLETIERQFVDLLLHGIQRVPPAPGGQP
jgi:AcrR family transcriptional regulator